MAKGHKSPSVRHGVGNTMLWASFVACEAEWLYITDDGNKFLNLRLQIRKTMMSADNIHELNFR